MPTELTQPRPQERIDATANCCPACGLPGMVDFFESQQLPILVGVVYDTPAAAQRAPFGEVTLAYCPRCDFVHNRKFDEARISFEPGYEVALSHSAMFREFTDNVCRRLIDRFDLNGKQIIEIGCGAGYFLGRLCELGGNFGTGFDTSVPWEGERQFEAGRVELRREYFTADHANLPCEFVCCLSVAEDIPHPAEFVRNLRQIIGDRRDIGIYFEVFNAFRAFRERETWSIHYEQCNYWGLDSFRSLFERNGFRVSDADVCYGNGQYLYVEAMPAQFDAPAANVAEDTYEIPAEVAQFSAHHQQKLTDWTERLSQLQSAGERVVVWGSGGKGISFLNSLPTTECIRYVVDINPDRQQKFIPGTAQQIVSPEFLIDYRPDKVVLTNRLYESEIRKQLSELGVECEFLTA